MKKLLLFLAIIFISTSCHKDVIPTQGGVQQTGFLDLLRQQKLPDDVRETPKAIQEMLNRRKQTNNKVETVHGTFCLFFDTDGGTYPGGTWFPGPTVYNNSSLTGPEAQTIINNLGNAYADWNIVFTTSETTYNSYTVSHRTRINVINDSLTNYFPNNVGGLSYIESIVPGFEEPAWVFTENLSHNVANITDAIVHETGHTFGLYHQANVTGCTLNNAYQYPIGSHPVQFVPWLGVPYNSDIKSFSRGMTSIFSVPLNCYIPQDEYAQINNYADYKADHDPNTIAVGNTYQIYNFPLAYTGVLETTDDIDIFKMPTITTPITRTVKVDVYGTMDIRCDFYTSAGVLWLTIDPSTSTNILQVVTFTTAISNGYIKLSPSTNNPNVPVPNIMTGKWRFWWSV